MSCTSYTSVYQVSNQLNESEIKYEKGGTVYVWGNYVNGGAIEFAGSYGQIPNLQDVIQIYACELGYAALLKDSSVYVWGNNLIAPLEGYLMINGEKITGIKTIRNTAQAFAAITNEGQVIIWGASQFGGMATPADSPSNDYSPPTIVPELTNIVKIYSTYGSFAAVNTQGQVWVWGSPVYGALGNGNIMNIPSLENVINITCNSSAFAALLPDKTVYVWGVTGNGGAISASQNTRGIVVGLTDVKSIYSTYSAFAALRYDGSVFIWGNAASGGSLNGINRYVNLPFYGVTRIYSTTGAFAAQLENQVYVWGSSAAGGNIIYNSGYNPMFIPNIKNICSGENSFAGLTVDNKIYVWGNPIKGGSTVYGDSSKYGIISISDNITSIVGAGSSFAALNESGEVIRWGDYLIGGGGTDGNPEFVPDAINIKNIFANSLSFGIVDVNNKINVWGNISNGGENSQISNLTNFGAVFSNYAGGAYAVLQIESEPIPPEPEKTAFNPALSGLIGAVLGLLIFISFYYIGGIKSESYRYSLSLIVILIAAGITILVSTLT